MCVLHMLFQHLKKSIGTSLRFFHYSWIHVVLVLTETYTLTGSLKCISCNSVCISLITHFKIALHCFLRLRQWFLGRIWNTSISLGHIIKRCDLKPSPGSGNRKVIDPVSRSFPKNDPLIYCFWVFSLFPIMTYKLISSSFSSFDSSWLICLMVPCFCSY